MSEELNIRISEHIEKQLREQRKGYFWGISPGEWITVCVIVASIISGYAVLVSEVKANSAYIAKNPKELARVDRMISAKIKSSENRTRTQMRDMEQRLREDIKELRKLLLNRTR